MHHLMPNQISACFRFRTILKKIIDTKMEMGEVMKIAAFSLAETKFIMGADLHGLVHHHVGQARVRVHLKWENVAGVTLPIYKQKIEGKRE